MLLVGVINAADLQLVSPTCCRRWRRWSSAARRSSAASAATSGTILGAIILTVLDSLLTLLDASQAVKQILYGLIILGLAWLYATSTRRV